MMGLEAIADMGGTWQAAVQSVATGMSGLGADELASTTQKAADALDVFAGTLQIVAVAASIMSSVNAAKTAQAVASTALAAANPLMWPNVAIALGAAALAGSLLYAVTSYKLKADLSTPSGVTAMAQSAEVLSA